MNKARTNVANDTTAGKLQQYLELSLSASVRDKTAVNIYTVMTRLSRILDSD